MKLRMLGLVVGLAVIVGSVVGGVAFANRGTTAPGVVVDHPMPSSSASNGHDDGDDHGQDTPHATPTRTGEGAEDALCEDPTPMPTATDCRRGADHPED